MAQNNDKYAYFVLLNPKKAKFSFSAYSSQDGEIKFVWNRKDYRTGEPMKRRFEFSRAYRTIRVPMAQVMKDPNGEVVRVVDFLREHPECAGSPNAPRNDAGVVTVKPMFKELNATKDAEIAIAARKYKVLAETAALELKGAKLEAIAMMAGYNPRNGEFKEALAIHKCLEFAASDPVGFMNLLSDDTHEMKSFLRKAIKAGVVNKVNDNYLWGKILLGTDEDDAVSELLSDVQLVRGIKLKMNKVDTRAYTPEDADKLAAKALELEKKAAEELANAKLKAAKIPTKQPVKTSTE